ncbi:MAG: hypothetical protein Q4C03_00715 [bacterium]|nr:hypothetical protein [bacterium]
MDVEMVPTIESRVTPAEIATAAEEFLKVCHRKTLIAMVDAYNLVPAGRREQAKEPFLVQTLKSFLAKELFSADPSKTLRTFQHHAPVEVRFLQQLTQETLEGEYYHFIACYGKAAFLFYLLSGEDEPRRAWAKTKMEETGTTLPTPEDAKTHLLHRFDALLRLKGEAPMASRQSQAQLEKLRQQLAEEKKTARRERQELEKKHQDECRELQTQLATAKFNIGEAKKAQQAAETALEKEKQLCAERVQQELAVKQIQLFYGWLRPHVKIEEAAQPPEADLFKAIDKAIQNQVALDRTSHHLVDIQAELAQCQEKQAEMDELMRGAHRIHPSLTAVYKQLEHRIETLRSALPEAMSTPFETQLLTQVKTVEEAQLPQLLSLIEGAEKMGMLSNVSVGKLRSAYNQRASIWENTSLIETEEDPIETRNPELRDALRGLAPLMLFLDGHNILNGLGRYRQRRGTANSHEKMRDRVQKDIVTLLRHLPMTIGHLVWDGPTLQTSSLSDNVQCHYSGGVGEHRADRYILDQLKYYRDTNAAIPCVLVTDDNDFGGEARRLGARVCRLHDFEAFMPMPYHG